MKNGLKNFAFGLVGGFIVLAIYLIVSGSNGSAIGITEAQPERLTVQPENVGIYKAQYATAPQDVNFVIVAEITVNAVVHIRTEIKQR